MALAVGDVIDVHLDRPAHGGYSVGRHDGQVVFVRLGIPGERVRAEITEIGNGGRFLRAETQQVLEVSADRVTPRCAHAVPGGCGGCDWQHATISRQRDMKADIIREQLVRVGKCDAADPLLTGLHVRACGDDVDGFHYRTRMDFVADQRGRLGLRSARSHNVIAVHECPLAVQAINDAEAFHQPWAAGATIRLAQAQSGTTVVADEETPATVTEAVGDIAFEVSAAGFWQVHRNAPAQFTALATELLQPKPGEFLLDLYGGVGLFAKTLGPVLGAGGRIVLVEGERVAGRYAKRNLRDLPHTEVVVERVDRWLADTRITKVDIVVLDPPRSGAGKQVLESVLRLRPRRVLYVACDPASLARDIAIARDRDYHLARLEAVDAFPHTAHVETFALLEPK
jgi:tRNA/tmRNA/rRNA uracil-C5-methylase (TrmA/RlmC/RlmD family)